MPYLALPLTLSGVSRRFNDRPISRKAPGSLSGGSFGGVIAAARADQRAVVDACGRSARG